MANQCIICGPGRGFCLPCPPRIESPEVDLDVVLAFLRMHAAYVGIDREEIVATTIRGTQFRWPKIGWTLDEMMAARSLLTVRAW